VWLAYQLFKSVAAVATITAVAALLTTKQQVGNRRGAETQYQNLKLQTWKKGEGKHHCKQQPTR